MNDITAIIVESNTLELTRNCLESLRRYYDLDRIVVDNRSEDGSREYVIDALQRRGDIVILNERNIGHGPGMHQALTLCQTPYALLLDSDCTVLASGWLEAMLSENAYMVGKQFSIDYGGIIRKHGEPYIHPACALLNVAQYLMLPPFNHHGMPCILNQRAARLTGLRLAAFDTDPFVRHLWAGTRKRYADRIEGWVRLERPYPHQARTANEMLEDNTVRIVVRDSQNWLEA